ncbi:MAG: hypothetical protein AAFX53_04090 [Bacteroidota bacterium]
MGPGNAEPIYNGKIRVNGNSFLLAETFDGDGYGANEFIHTYYFEK